MTDNLKAKCSMKYHEYQIFKTSYAKNEDATHISIYDSFIEPLHNLLEREWDDSKGEVFLEYLEKAFKFFNIEQRLFGDH